MSLLRELITEANLAEVVIALMDILLVYYLIYRVLLTIKGTRAAQMMTGIVLIGAAFYAAERFEMTTVSWLLDNFIQYFIIIVIVVFQQDIRRALMRIGQNVSQWGKTTREVSHALDEVIAASEHLAKARIGGIVVFEREANLDDFINSGKLIGAQVSKELLVSLFVPSRDNELHDGAVVLRELEILKAGVVLPLSRSDLASDFGTRHRAAIGITEETDAVAVVISEERGEISLCFRGGIARDLEADTLRSALDNLFSSPAATTTGRTGAPAIDEGAEAALAISKAVAAMAGNTGEHRAVTESDNSSAHIRLPTRPDPTVPS